MEICPARPAHARRTRVTLQWKAPSSPPTQQPNGWATTPSMHGRFPPQKANTYVHPEVPIGILFQLLCPLPPRLPCDEEGQLVMQVHLLWGKLQVFCKCHVVPEGGQMQTCTTTQACRRGRTARGSRSDVGGCCGPQAQCRVAVQWRAPCKGCRGGGGSTARRIPPPPRPPTRKYESCPGPRGGGGRVLS